MNPDGYITKAEYIRRLKWNNDVLSVTDSIKSEMMQKTEEVVLDHFDMDMSDLREYMRDKEEWKRKQAAMPKWIPVTEGLPENFVEVLVTDGKDVGIAALQGFMDDEVVWCNAYGMDYIDDPDDEDYLPITHWMPLPEPPKEV